MRTYRGHDRRPAEEAYRLDATQAEIAAWFPVAHRWDDGWHGHLLVGPWLVALPVSVKLSALPSDPSDTDTVML